MHTSSILLSQYAEPYTITHSFFSCHTAVNLKSKHYRRVPEPPGTSPFPNAPDELAHHLLLSTPKNLHNTKLNINILNF